MSCVLLSMSRMLNLFSVSRKYSMVLVVMFGYVIGSMMWCVSI